jgi:hypothetical protein
LRIELLQEQTVGPDLGKTLTRAQPVVAFALVLIYMVLSHDCWASPNVAPVNVADLWMVAYLCTLTLRPRQRGDHRYGC